MFFRGHIKLGFLILLLSFLSACNSPGGVATSDIGSGANPSGSGTSVGDVASNNVRPSPSGVPEPVPAPPPPGNLDVKIICQWTESASPQIPGFENKGDKKKIVNYFKGALGYQFNNGWFPCEAAGFYACTGQVIRMIDWDKYQYKDIPTKKTGNTAGVFEISFISDLTPHVDFYIADQNYDPALTGQFVACADKICLPADTIVWKKIALPECVAEASGIQPLNLNQINLK